MRISLSKAAELLKQGGVVALPTETVYGLGANAFDPDAVARIFELKGRPRFDPLIVHVPSLEAAEKLTSAFPQKARILAERFWPGPLTLVLEKAPCIPDIVTSGLPRVGLRVPNHPLTLELLKNVQLPLAAPSANPFGRVSPTTAGHVESAFGEAVAVLDGGPCACGVESTVVMVESDHEPVVLLRPGGLSLEDIQSVVGEVSLGSAESALQPPAPGMLKRHYAPRVPLFLDPVDLPFKRMGWLGLGAPKDPSRFQAIESLSPEGDVREAAAALFGAMRRLETQDLEAIWAESVPNEGLGRAINDRLKRASER